MQRSQPLQQTTSSGCAVHRTLNEAFEHATLELIERHVTMEWWLNGAQAVTVNLDRGDETLSEIVERVHTLECTVKVLNIPNVWNIPVTVALLSTKDGAVFFGSAAKATFSRAISHAVLEAFVGALATMESQPPEPLLANQVRTPLDHRAFWLQPSHRGMLAAVLNRTVIDPTVCWEDRYGFIGSGDVIETVAKSEHEVLGIDVTTPDLMKVGLYAGRVLISDLHSIWFGQIPFLKHHKHSISDPCICTMPHPFA